MFIVKTSVRAFVIASLPLVALHMLLFANNLGEQATSNQVALPPPDRAFGMLALRAMLDMAGLAAGHFMARHLGLGSRGVYALIGGAAAALGYALAYQNGLMLHRPYEGAVVTAAILPTLVGMLAGFLYGQVAGREVIAASRTQSGRPASAMPAAVAPVPAVLAPMPTEPAPAPPPTSFDGPVQVRTSIGVMLLAAVLPALLVTLLSFTLMYPTLSDLGTEPGASMQFKWARQVSAFGLPIQILLILAMTTIAPCTIFVATAHAVARALSRTRSLHYAGVGALTGLVLGLALVPLFGAAVALVAPLLAGLGALMMAVYRRFAGLEPRSLPEPVLAREIEALVPEDHPSRRTRAVVLNG